MTERELIQQRQELGDSRFLVTRSGKFFSAYGCGAFALARATGYRVMHRGHEQAKCCAHTDCGKPCRESDGTDNSRRRENRPAGRRFFRLFRHRRQRSGGVGLHPEETEGRQDRKGSKSSYDNSLQAMILSFDLSRSTPMDAMNFIDLLQKRIYDTDV